MRVGFRPQTISPLKSSTPKMAQKQAPQLRRGELHPAALFVGKYFALAMALIIPVIGCNNNNAIKAFQQKLVYSDKAKPQELQVPEANCWQINKSEENLQKLRRQSDSADIKKARPELTTSQLSDVLNSQPRVVKNKFYKYISTTNIGKMKLPFLEEETLKTASGKDSVARRMIYQNPNVESRMMNDFEYMQMTQPRTISQQIRR